MRDKLKKFIELPITQNVILALIIVNAIILGLMTSDNIVENYGTLLNVLNNLCLAIFIVELLIKLFIYKFSFFKDGWNNFDFIIIAIALLPSGGVFSSLRMLRTFRVFRSLRSLRMVSKLERLQLIVKAIIGSLPSIGWTSLLLGIIYYIFAIIGTELFGDAFPEWFGTLGSTIYTLFQVMTLESWSMGISRPVMEVFPFAYLYFVPFIVFTAFIVLNVVIGVVVNTISELSDNEKLEKLESNCEEKDIQIYHEYLKLQEQMDTFKKVFEKNNMK